MPIDPRIVVFLVAMGLVFSLAFYFAATAAYARIPFLRPPHSRLYRTVSSFFIALGLLGILSTLYGFFIEPNWPKVDHVTIESPKLKRHIRFVQISDIHSDPKARLEPRLPALIAAEKPDFIVFTGDASNREDEEYGIFRKLMSDLSRLAPTYAVKGNWDMWYGSSEDLYAGTGVTLLQDQVVQYGEGGNAIKIAGLTAGHGDQVDALLKVIEPRTFNIFLDHFPDEIYDVDKYPVDLYCAGHTHGGQVALPFYGAIVTFSRFGKRFERGLYRVENTWLYVNRGIGMEGGYSPRVRFLARPEITVFDLVPTSSAR